MITYCQSIRLQTFSLWKADNKTVLFIYKPVLRFWFFVTLQIIEWWEISLWRRAAIRPSITEPVESPNHTEILCLFSKCFKHHVLPHNFLRECMSVLALGCMSLWRPAPSLQDVDFSVLCGFMAHVDTRTQRSKCDSWQSSLLCCLTLSSNASSSSTWMGWWVTPWRCTRTGRLWICGAIKRRTRSERSKLLSFDNNTARNRSCWTPTAQHMTRLLVFLHLYRFILFSDAVLTFSSALTFIKFPEICFLYNMANCVFYSLWNMCDWERVRELLVRKWLFPFRENWEEAVQAAKSNPCCKIVNFKVWPHINFSFFF